MTVYYHEKNRCVEVLNVEEIEYVGDAFRFRKFGSSRFSKYRSVYLTHLKVIQDE